MSDFVTLFPNVLQPTVALKTYTPVGVKFWQSEQTVLAGMQEFAEGWFARRQAGTTAALETVKRIGEAATPLDAAREYQDWLGGAIGRIVEDGLAYQQHLLKAGAQFGAKPAAEAVAATAAAAQTVRQSADQSNERRTG
jgi:hypothetical protein